MKAAEVVVTPAVLDRVCARLVQEGDCWVWPGGHGHRGHGMTEISGRTIGTHRVTYLGFIGPIPDGLELDHLCRNPPCCNPWHLDPVTHRVNVLRGTSFASVNARKDECPRGHPYDRIAADGRRTCRTCAKEVKRRGRARRKALGLRRT